MINLSEETTLFRKHSFPLLFLLVSITLVYYNSLNSDFIFDDSQIQVRTNLHINKLDFESLKGTFYWSPKQKRIYRPLSCLTLGLNYYFGGEDPFGYHVVNIAIHILCAFSVYIFLHVLLSIRGIRPTFAVKYRYEISVIATFLFALHPIQTNVASYIIQRMTSMAALFYIISITGYLVFRMDTLPGSNKSSFKRYSGLAIFIMGGICAVLSKENTVVLPGMILIADYLLFYRNGTEQQQKKLFRIYIYFVLAFLTLFVVFGLKPLLSYMGGQGRFANLNRGFTPIERLLTESRVVFFYLYLLFIPNLNLLNLNHDFLISKNIYDPPQTFFAIIGIAILLTGAYFFRKNNNLVSFAIAWFFVNLLIESTILPLEIIFEHRTYLPGVMIFLIISFGIVYTGKIILKNDNFMLVTSLILILFAHGTYLRNVVFSNRTSVWLDVIEKSPKFARGYANLGKAYWERGYPLKAKSAYEKALKLKPDMVEPMTNLALINLNFYKDTITALELAKKSLRMNPQDTRPPRVLADVYMRNKNYKKAEHYYNLSLKRLFFNSEAINGLGISKIKLRKKDEAIKIFKYGIQMDPSYEYFYLNLANLYANKNRFSEAIKTIEKYLSISSNSVRAQTLLKKYKERSQGVKFIMDEE